MSKDKSGNWFSRHKVLSVLGAIVVLIIIISIANGGGSKTANDNTKAGQKTSSKNKPDATVAKIGQPARDGKFEFTVKSVKCGVSSVGGQYLNKAAQGQFCILNMSVKNIGDEAQTLDASNQYLFDSQSKKYSADSEASYEANPEGSTFLEQVNPGNSASGKFVFDVPKSVTPANAELHDSAFSDGIKVGLQQ